MAGQNQGNYGNQASASAFLLPFLIIGKKLMDTYIKRIFNFHSF